MSSSRHIADFNARGCALDPSVWPCIGVGVLLGLFGFTLLCVVVQLIRITRATKRYWSHQQVILLLALVEVVLGIIHYGAVKVHAIILCITWLKLMQLVVICYFFSSAALRIFRSEHLTRWVVLPVLGVVTIYLTAILAVGSTRVLLTGDDCQDVTWLIFSVSGFVLTVMFMIGAFFILRKLSRMEVSGGVRQKSKLQLWSLSIIWFFTTLGVMVYDIFLNAAATGGDECDLYLNHNLAADALVHVALRTFELLFPIWAVCYAFNDATKTRNTAPLAHLRGGGDLGSGTERSGSDFSLHKDGLKRGGGIAGDWLGGGSYSQSHHSSFGNYSHSFSSTYSTGTHSYNSLSLSPDGLAPSSASFGARSSNSLSYTLNG
jgi:hypothetical protein